MGGGDYVRCKEGMEIIAEGIMTNLQFEEFMKSKLFMSLECSVDQEELIEIPQILIKLNETLCANNISSMNKFKRDWNESKTSGIKLKEVFCKFVSSQESNDNYR